MQSHHTQNKDRNCWWFGMLRGTTLEEARGLSSQQGKGLAGAQSEIPGTTCGYCSLQLVAAIGKCSVFKAFSGICARKLGCMTFRAKFRITSISHSPNTFYDNISKPFMDISYSSLSSFEMENRKASLLAANRAMNVDLLMVTEENCDGDLGWERRKEKENQFSNVNCLLPAVIETWPVTCCSAAGIR